MIKYEYQFLNIEYTPDKLTKKLTHLGNDGWKVHTILPSSLTQNVAVLLEREISGPSVL